MQSTLWRISNHHDLSGKGSLMAPARWHSMALPVVYLAESPSGALLEHLVHLVSRNGRLPETYGLLKISVPEEFAIHELNPDNVDDWKGSPHVTQGMGDNWLRSLKTPLARVPSVIMPYTWNILLNPRHPDAASIEITAATREPFDTRLFRFGPG